MQEKAKTIKHNRQSSANCSGGWLELVQSAKASKRGLSDLFKAIRPRLVALSVHIVGKRFADDAVQAALVKIWRKLDCCDLSRDETIERWIVQVGIRAMRDEGRSQRRKYRQYKELTNETADQADDAASTAGVFSGLLAVYVEDLRENNNDFTGIHARVGAKLGIQRGRMSSLFHEAVRKFIEETPAHEIDRYRRESRQVRIADLLVNSGRRDTADQRTNVHHRARRSATK